MDILPDPQTRVTKVSTNQHGKLITYIGIIGFRHPTGDIYKTALAVIVLDDGSLINASINDIKPDQ